MNHSVVVIRRNTHDAEACTRILGLPDLAWSDVQVEFGTDCIAIARVGIILTPEQLIALATIASGGHS